VAIYQRVTGLTSGMLDGDFTMLQAVLDLYPGLHIR
jgi:hypothetical protein